MKKILILGSTGSIGTQAAEVIRANRDAFEVVGIAAAGSDPAAVVAQAREFGLQSGQVAVQRDGAAAEISAALGGDVIAGQDAARRLVEAEQADVVLNALVGAAGLSSTLAALDTGAVLALANKESLVAGGRLVLDRAGDGQLVPVDSEHSAMAQCLRAGRASEVSRFVLTASGGPFRGWSRERMMDVTPEQAVTHPTWSMGTMNTINSATMVNKGLELIEASLLFGIDPDIIDVTVHPQSVVHSMVTFVDGASIAQASPPSMKMPIAHALAWPGRVAGAQPALDFSKAIEWTFEPLDTAAFPAVELARAAAKQGDPYPAVYNAANEVAVDAFFAGRIRFPEIVDVVAAVLDGAGAYADAPSGVEDVLAVDSRAREEAAAAVERIGG
ncbi:1-deoxy-D-xylulose-5-phosphate reductoisomerase [Corynebacterium sp. CNCTC7651]|uniref:1-deoxy-D-xylulose-5-phosphate reductoisomerase n=1 Tax=Corynebacterium sp. CNCTC7651 TaxID=2815361 RepID=UPI001F002CB4|nr:1-deoxy-D-xylulose-5-phosphate reductoisomerase [Corynebacterium sp. CNCTC7651]UIZ91489.1 1-deoxy-D-xylulose-5-phosphate reductoisomerase [Corynebacterium sp. CNCTC7651]